MSNAQIRCASEMSSFLTHYALKAHSCLLLWLFGCEDINVLVVLRLYYFL